MQYCKKCLYPSTRPEQVFSNDICDACHSVAQKYKIDWKKRHSEFEDILKNHRSKNGEHDCIIPISGGKDSCYQALTMRDKYKINPLCVNFIPCEMTEVGSKNILFLRDQGFDIIQVGMNRSAYRKLTKIGFEKLGDCCWPEHIGIFTIPSKIAVKFKIPLIIWGENSQFEYGGPATKKDNNFLDRNWLEQFQMLGYRLHDCIADGVEMNEIKMLEYPSDSDIEEVGVTGLFMGYFEPWDTLRNLNLVEKMGWHRNDSGPIDGAYNDFENLDCKWIGGLHDYMKFIKYGYGRASDQLSIEIRANRLTRNEAIERLKNTSEGKLPKKYINDFQEFIGISEEYFQKVLDRFTNKSLFKLDSDGNLLKDNENNLKRKFFPS